MRVILKASKSNFGIKQEVGDGEGPIVENRYE
jgi:hypothetical protein